MDASRNPTPTQRDTSPRRQLFPRRNQTLADQRSDSHRVLNYVTANRFYVEIESQLTACFSSCQGLSIKNNTTLIREGGLNTQQRVLLGAVSYTQITLSHGISDSLLFWEWMQKTMIGGKDIRRNINILIFNQAGETIQCWTLIGAVPVNWKAPSLQATSSNVALEELVLAYEGLRVTAKTGGGGATLLSNGRDRKGFFGGS
jgi:phage tail-like protein